MTPLLQGLRDLKSKILASRDIFGALSYPKHLHSDGKCHTGPVGDVLKEMLNTGG